MNLLYLAQNGLSAAQCALNVVGNNLTNAVTVGYSRQNILFGEAGGQSTNYGFLAMVSPWMTFSVCMMGS